ALPGVARRPRARAGRPADGPRRRRVGGARVGAADLPARARHDPARRGGGTGPRRGGHALSAGAPGRTGVRTTERWGYFPAFSASMIAAIVEASLHTK